MATLGSLGPYCAGISLNNVIPAAPQFVFELLLMLLLAPFIDLYGAWIRRETTLARGSIKGRLTCTSKFPLVALLCAIDGINDTGKRMKKMAVCKIVFLDMVIIFRCKNFFHRDKRLLVRRLVTENAGGEN